MTPARAGWFAATLRPVLWVGVAFNAAIAILLAFPGRLDVLSVLPPLDSDFYRWMLVWFVLVFSATYAWMALQPRVAEAMLGLASLGKAGVFVVALVFWLRGDVAGRTLAVTGIDLAFSIWFMLCLRALDTLRANGGIR
jgi:hypothetical protein